MRAPAGDPLDPAHLGPEAIRRYLRAHHLTARRELSQNHLADPAVLADIVAAAEIAGERPVLEIGPGLGILTWSLLAAGAGVVAVELDTRLAELLRRRFAGRLSSAPMPAAEGATAAEGAAGPCRPAPGEVVLIEGDALAVPAEDIVAPPYEVVANLPYHITSPVLHHLLARDPRPERLVLMLQREVAERIAAPPGAMSYLSVFVQYHADVRVVRDVPAACFEPAPEVDSAVLVGDVRPRSLPEDAEERLWRVVQAGFRERRKMLHNVLARQLPDLGRYRVEAALAATGIAPERRPQTLSVAEWIALAGALAAPDGVPVGGRR